MGATYHNCCSSSQPPPVSAAMARSRATRYCRTRGLRSRRDCRAEVVERTFAHMYETSGMRRVWVRGHENVRKRVLIQAAACNIGLLLRRQTGIGTPRSLQGRAVSAIWGLIRRLIGCWERLTRAWGFKGGRRRSSAQSIIANLPEQQDSVNRLLPRADNLESKEVQNEATQKGLTIGRRPHTTVAGRDSHPLGNGAFHGAPPRAARLLTRLQLCHDFVPKNLGCHSILWDLQ